jgi:hypothetical protein
MILSSNGPIEVTDAVATVILLQINSCVAFVNPNPRSFHSRRQAAKISRQKFPWSPQRRRPPRSPCQHQVLPGASTPLSSPPRSLRAIVPDHGQAPLRAATFPDLS